MIYRFVDILNSHGLSAAVVHRSPRFRCTWFNNTTQIVGAQDVRFARGDLLVLPERLRERIPRVAPGVANVILNQNAYETYTNLPFRKGLPPEVTSVDTIGIVCVSDENHRYLQLCFPSARIERVRIGIDADLFRTNPSGKKRAIAYMPRKRLKDLSQVLQILNQRGSLKEWELVPIDGMSEIETARALGDSAIFIGLNEREGLGLPSLEAMASGCVVIGFHGGVGLEYMGNGHAIAIDDGDVITMVHEIESALARWGRDRTLDSIAEGAASFVRDTYSRDNEIDDVVRIFGDALERLTDVQPRVERINVSLLPRRGLRIRVGERLLATVQNRRTGLS